MFLIYVNDISNALPGDKLKLYADDTNLIVYGSSISAVKIEGNHYLKCMEYGLLKINSV